MILQTMIQIIAEYMGLLWLTISFPLYINIYYGETLESTTLYIDSYYILKKKERHCIDSIHIIHFLFG